LKEGFDIFSLNLTDGKQYREAVGVLLVFANISHVLSLVQIGPVQYRLDVFATNTERRNARSFVCKLQNCWKTQLNRLVVFSLHWHGLVCVFSLHMPFTGYAHTQGLSLLPFALYLAGSGLVCMRLVNHLSPVEHHLPLIYWLALASRIQQRWIRRRHGSWHSVSKPQTSDSCHILAPPGLVCAQSELKTWNRWFDSNNPNFMDL
jgi:hypothetical protein